MNSLMLGLAFAPYSAMDPWALLFIPALAVSCAIAKVAYEAIVRIGRLFTGKLERKILDAESVPPQSPNSEP
jgi:hypothetical protein